ncbi:MAG: hypothetical protein HKN19_14320 [Halioglobus sp.]|nr:hypothetical protein [Halioglobus sp.]
MTPYEWQQWYEENGVPGEHRDESGWLVRKWKQFKASVSGMTSTKPGH